jgi:hypothetical protein
MHQAARVRPRRIDANFSDLRTFAASSLSTLPMSTLTRALIALLLAAACHPPASPPTPAEARDADELLTVLSREIHYTFAADGSYTRVAREHHRWNDTPPGERVLAAERARWDHAPAELAAIITRPSGARFRLDPATIRDDGYKVWAPLPDLRPGTEVLETITRRSAGAPAWSEVLEEPLQSYVPLRRLTVVIESPIALKIRHAIEGTAIPAREEIVGDTRRLTWTAADIPPEDHEFDVPHDLFVEPRLVLRAHDHSWQAVARAYGDLVDAALADFTVPPEARAIIAADTTRAHKIAALTVWRRRHADELTPTIDAATPPLSPAAVRTDEATVLVGLLRAAGIPAHVALHRDQLFQADGSPAFPGLRQFTATIVVVPGPEPLWIEPVGDNTPPGRISHGDLGRLALIAAPETTSLVRLPFPRPEDNTYRETHAITLAAYGPARARTEISTTGYHEDFVRDDWVYGQKNDPTQWTLTRRFARHNLRSIEVSPADDILVPLRAVVDADTTDETRTDLDSARVALDWHTLIDLPGPWADPRQNPHTVTPYDNSLTYRVTLPPGFTAQIPAFNPPDLAPLQVERTVAHDGDTLVVTLHARLAVDRVSVEQYDRLHREVPRLAAEHGHILAIHDARLARERGDLRAAHTLVARDAADPNSGTIARLRLADQLRRVHLHARALAEVRAVIAAEPDHALAHAMLADLLRTDRLGRARRSGWDRSGAMAASLRAAELDETRIRARLDAADDAETGDDGALYGPGSDLARAAELRAAIRTYELERLADPAPIVRELELLWHLGRLDELADRPEVHARPPADRPAHARVARPRRPRPARRPRRGSHDLLRRAGHRPPRDGRPPPRARVVRRPHPADRRAPAARHHGRRRPPSPPPRRPAGRPPRRRRDPAAAARPAPGRRRRDEPRRAARPAVDPRRRPRPRARRPLTTVAPKRPHRAVTRAPPPPPRRRGRLPDLHLGGRRRPRPPHPRPPAHLLRRARGRGLPPARDLAAAPRAAARGRRAARRRRRRGRSPVARLALRGRLAVHRPRAHATSRRSAVARGPGRPPP